MTSIRPNSREMKVLQGLCLGDIEDEAHFPFVGRKTFDAMIGKGWIEPATCETYGTVGYRITSDGEAAHQVGYDAGM